MTEKKFLALCASVITLAAITAGAYFFSGDLLGHDEETLTPFVLDLPARPTAPEIALQAAQPPQVATTPTETPIAPTGSPEPVKRLYGTASKSISRQVAIEQYQKGGYWGYTLSVVSEVEGFVPRLYRDNIGGAIGNGWNLGVNQRATNAKVAAAIGITEPALSGLLSMSAPNQKPASFPTVSITPGQASEAAKFMVANIFQPTAEKALGSDVWAKLKPNQQAVVSYHVYKTGNLNWPNLKASIKQCANTQDPAICKKTAEQFTYSYKLDGVKKFDTRSQLYMGALFQDPEAYAYLLGTQTAPANFSGETSGFSMKIDPTKNADPQVQQLDTFNPAKETVLEKGGSITLEEQKPPTPKHALPYGYY